MKSPLIYLIAGEASGDALGAGLMRALKEQQPDVRFAGIGGEAMAAQGLASLFPYSELSIMGFLEVVPHIPALLRRMRETALDIAEKQPTAIVTIDSPGFNFRLAGALKKNVATSGIKRIHYVAPSVWAYKPGRARKTAQLFDRLLTLLPFEPPYFEKEGLRATFVGHPVLWNETHGDAAAFRARHNLAADARLLLVLPGSRRGEIGYHLKLFLDAARALPAFTPVILAGAQVREFIRQQVPGTLIADITEKYDAFAAAEMALTKSGTISLELAQARLPMVVAHRSSPLSAWLIKRMILIRHVSLANIAVDRAVIPELLQEHCNAREIAQALTQLTMAEARERQLSGCAEALAVLRGKNTEEPSVIAAKTVLKLLSNNLNVTKNPTQDDGACENCHHTFPYKLIHNGFSDSAYAYCDRCGTTGFMSAWKKDIPPSASFKAHGPVSPETESLLTACSCGGKFLRDASPRCPSCLHELSAVLAGTWIERNAPGTAKGWKWARTWHGLYAIIIAGKSITLSFK